MKSTTEEEMATILAEMHSSGVATPLEAMKFANIYALGKELERIANATESIAKSLAQLAAMQRERT